MLNRLLFGKKYGICVFCGKKINLSESVFHDEHACVCKQCNSIIKVAPFNFLYEGSKYLSFIVAPLYYTPIVREAIHNLKFSSMPKAASVLAYYINTYLLVFEESDESLMNNFDVIMPVPLSNERKKKRGYNQAELLANHISKYFNMPLDTTTLVKIRNTTPQSLLSYEEKLKNLTDAYECKNDVCNKKILLIDDVCTTSSTLNACAKVLKDNGALTVGAITVAHGGAKKHSKLYNELFS